MCKLRKSTRQLLGEQMNILKNNSAFTLIELMIVVAILGVLVSITLPSYHQYTVKTQLSEALLMTEQLKPNIVAYYKKHRRLPQNNGQAGLPDAQHLISNFVVKVNVEKGALHLTLGNKINQKLMGKVLSIQPLTVDGSPNSPMDWGCGYADAPKGMSKQGANNTDIDHYYLPVRCRI